jgi:IAA-amino acid hydrolase
MIFCTFIILASITQCIHATAPSSINCSIESNSQECKSSNKASWLEHEMSQISWPSHESSFLSTVQSFFANPTDDNNDDNLQTTIRNYASRLLPTLISIRRLLHRHPELMYQERITGQILQRILQDMGITDISIGWAKNIHSKFYNQSDDDEEYDGGGYGLVIDIGSGEGPCVLLRADMDALPIVEETPLPPDVTASVQFRSHHHGKMHACGHDAHMTMLLGAVYMIHSLKQDEKLGYAFPGTVRIIFQPAEEGGAGAKRMSEEGVLTRHPAPSYAFAMHVWPTLKSGEIGFRSGPMLGAADSFTLEIEGVGGHAAFPHLVVDPIVAASSIVLNAQTLVSRNLNPLESGVVSITQFDAGDGAHNVIPAKAVLRGTIRSLSDEGLTMLREGLINIATNAAAAQGCSLKSYTFSRDHYPVTMNDDKLYPFAAKVASMVAIGGEVTKVDPTMGAEDFAFLAQGVPAAFFFLGQGGQGEENCVGACKSGAARVPTNLGLHHPEFNLDETILPRGVELFVNLALRALHDLKNSK